MIGMIDMKQIRNHPKILIGFSDLTVLLNAIHQKTGLVTFHGPVVTTLANIDRQSNMSFFNVLAGKTANLIAPTKLKVLKNGMAKGVLMGGNLTTLIHMIGTPYEIPWNKAIIFLEDTGESPYRLDRLLTHLHQAKRLQKLKGLILGTFTDENNKESSRLQKIVQERIAELLKDTEIPIWANFQTGHSRKNLTMPVGLAVEMDLSRGGLYWGLH